jgi:hypothetical protein
MKEMGGATTKYEEVLGAIPAEQPKEQQEQAPIPNHLLPYHLQVCRFFFSFSPCITGSTVLTNLEQEPSWLDRKRGFYFGCHASIWRIRMYNILFWIVGMCLILALFISGLLGSVVNVYIGTAICWLASFIFKETSLTATCLFGTALSVWTGGDVLSKSSKYIV